MFSFCPFFICHCSFALCYLLLGWEGWFTPAFTGNEELLVYCRNRFKTVLVPNQIAPDGSFPEELRRTKPYGYSLFNLEAMAAVCQILSTPEDNLWNFATPDGRGVGKAMEFMAPYIRDKRSWPKPKDVMYDNEWPMRQSSLLFAGVALNRPDYIALWKTLPADSNVEEVVRNFFIRQPVLWVGELITTYDPAVLWFDGEWQDWWTEEDGQDLYRYVRGLKPNIVINNRVGKGRQGMQGMNKTDREYSGDFGTPERRIPPSGLPGVDWESCMTMNTTWGYKFYDDKWKTAETLVRNLIDVASKGGNYLLNVGPMADGLIPQPSVERLAELGKWMKVNGEAIYSTSASPFPAELAFGRATSKPGKVYLHVFDWPADGSLRVPAPGREVKRAYLLASPKNKLAVTRSSEGITIAVPATAPDSIATVIVLEHAK